MPNESENCEKEDVWRKIAEHKDRLRAVAFSLCHNPSDVDDLVSRTLERAIVAIAAAMALAAHGAEVHAEVASPAVPRVLAPWNGEVTGVSTNGGIVCMDYALRPTKRSFIRCQLLLPPQAKWTGRFWGQGNGGQAGGKPRAMTAFANVGDAVAHTDMGSSDAYGNPGAWTDFPKHRVGKM